MSVIQGQLVMLDSDLAILYSILFPDAFVLQLSDAEEIDLWSQFATTKRSNKSRSY